MGETGCVDILRCVACSTCTRANACTACSTIIEQHGGTAGPARSAADGVLSCHGC
jgi:hypothetical protein